MAVVGEGVEVGVGGGVIGLPGLPKIPAAEEKRTNAAGNCGGFGEQVQAAWSLGAEDVCRVGSGVRLVRVASSRIPAVWMTVVRGCSVGMLGEEGG